MCSAGPLFQSFTMPLLHMIRIFPKFTVMRTFLKTSDIILLLLITVRVKNFGVSLLFVTF